MRRIATLALILPLLLIGCSGPSAVAEAEAEEEGYTDANVAADFNSKPEARDWIRRENTVFFEISKETGLEIVDKLYALGSPKVVVIDSEPIQEGSTTELGSTLVAEMPAEADKRKALLDYSNELLGDEEKDSGQKYLVIYTD